LDRNIVLPVLHALQGHPESGKLWKEHINNILTLPELNFQSTIVQFTMARLRENASYCCDKLMTLRWHAVVNPLLLLSMTSLANSFSNQMNQIRRSPTLFAIQDWKDNNDILIHHIPGVINPSDSLTKPTGWVLHSRHYRRLMNYFGF
jgi:hypothetical protein